jgi:hypothetical protein
LPEGNSIKEKWWKPEEDNLVMEHQDKTGKEIRKIFLEHGFDRTSKTIKNRINWLRRGKPNRHLNRRKNYCVFSGKPYASRPEPKRLIY